MYETEYRIHPQVNNEYDLNEEDSIVFTRESEYLEDAKSLDCIWDVLEDHPELDDMSFMIEVLIKDEDKEEQIEEVSVIEAEVESEVPEEEVKDEEIPDEEEVEEYLEKWKMVCFADVFRFIDDNSIYRDGSTLSVKSYHDGELPNLNGMISQLTSEDRQCYMDDSNHIVIGPIISTEDDANIPEPEPEDGDDSDDNQGILGDDSHIDITP